MDVHLMIKHDTFSRTVSVAEASDVFSSSSSSSSSSVDVLMNQTSEPLVLPSFNVMELDTESSITHLLKAYGEAMEMKMTELGEEILIRLSEKGSLTGSILQRLAYYLNRALDDKVQLSWKDQTAAMNYEIAFNAFYQILPFGRFAHFASNSVIIEAFSNKDIVVLHIVDFDFDKGVQWPPIILALSVSSATQPKRVLKLTSVKWEEEEEEEEENSYKKVLYEYARNFGVKLEIEEMGLENLGKKMKKNEGNEWLAFNCMVGLPHMGKRRSVSDVIEFLKIAKDSIASNCSQGTITFGDGIGWGKGLKGWVGYGSIFEGQLCQFEAFLESIDTHFPQLLREARIAIECLFVVPYICSLIDPEMWEDISRESRGLSELGLKAWKMTEENVGEGKELVKEGESYFWVNIEGLKHNQMVLGYKGTPLIKVSSWTYIV